MADNVDAPNMLDLKGPVVIQVRWTWAPAAECMACIRQTYIKIKHGEPRECELPLRTFRTASAHSLLPSHHDNNFDNNKKEYS